MGGNNFVFIGAAILAEVSTYGLYVGTHMVYGIASLLAAGIMAAFFIIKRGNETSSAQGSAQ